jgi:hypothetical protein
MSHVVMVDWIDGFIVELRHDSNVSVSWQSHDSHRGDRLSPVQAAR